MAPKPTSSGNLAPRASWEPLGLDFGPFGVHFELPNRSKNDTENKLMFKRFLGPLEIRGSEILIVILTWFGPGGGPTWGGN